MLERDPPERLQPGFCSLQHRASFDTPKGRCNFFNRWIVRSDVLVDENADACGASGRVDDG